RFSSSLSIAARYAQSPSPRTCKARPKRAARRAGARASGARREPLERSPKVGRRLDLETQRRAGERVHEPQHARVQSLASQLRADLAHERVLAGPTVHAVSEQREAVIG